MQGQEGLIRIFEYALNQEQTDKKFFQDSRARLNIGSAVSAFERLIQESACIYQPNPAVITTNAVIGGFMVEATRHFMAGVPWLPLLYDATIPHKIGRVD